MDDHDYIRITCTCCGNEVEIPTYCKNRFCAICGRNRLQLIRYKLNHLVDAIELRDGFGIKHLTLAARSGTDLKLSTGHLIRSFRKMRQRALWRQHVKGGAFVVEFTKNDAGWHPHLHIIIEAKYIDWTKLRDLWRDCSRGSSVYIQRLPKRAITVYLTKYLTKISLSPDDQIIASEALKGIRLFNPFGKWHGKVMLIRPPHPVCGNCNNSAWQFIPQNSYFDWAETLPEWVKVAQVRNVRGSPGMIQRINQHALSLDCEVVRLD